MSRLSFFISILYCFFSIVSKGQAIEGSQQINLIDYSANNLFRLDFNTLECKEFTAKGLQRTHKIKLNNVKLNDLPPTLSANNFQLSPNKFLITIEGTGQTYLYDTYSHQLSRKDKTYFRGYNFRAIQFIRQDTLISLGGNGFWRNHNIPTFFHKKLHEWELFGSINENGPKAISSQFGGYSPLTDQIYCLEFPELYSEKNDNNYPFYTFNFKNNAWNKLGHVDFTKLELKHFNKYASQWIAPYFFSYEISLGEFIDPIENKIYRYQGKNHAFFHSSISWFIKKNYIYAYQKVYTQNNFDLLLDSMSIDQLKANSIVIGNFYTPDFWYNEIDWKEIINYMIVFILSSLFIGLLQYIKKKYNRALDHRDQLPEAGELFLKYLISQPNYSCTTEKLNEILKCEDKTIESQRQYRSKFILSVNVYFERYFNLPNAITRHQSDIDKRYVDYQLNPTAVEIINKHFNK